MSDDLLQVADDLDCAADLLLADPYEPAVSTEELTAIRDTELHHARMLPIEALHASQKYLAEKLLEAQAAITDSRSEAEGAADVCRTAAKLARETAEDVTAVR